MASSQDKAIALKDAYVNGIMDGAVEQKAADTQQAFAQMPGQDMGDQAMYMANLDAETLTIKNDGYDNVMINKGGSIVATKDPMAANDPRVAGRHEYDYVTIPMDQEMFNKYDDQFNRREYRSTGATGRRNAAKQEARKERSRQAVKDFQTHQNNYNLNRPRTITPNGFGGYTMY